MTNRAFQDRQDQDDQSDRDSGDSDGTKATRAFPRVTRPARWSSRPPQNWPSKAFNRLVAQVPAVTVTLEYGDAEAGGRRQLRAIDGRIVGQRAV